MGLNAVSDTDTPLPFLFYLKFEVHHGSKNVDCGLRGCDAGNRIGLQDQKDSQPR
jgi:hypothetical protein